MCQEKDVQPTSRFAEKAMTPVVNVVVVKEELLEVGEVLEWSTLNSGDIAIRQVQSSDIRESTEHSRLNDGDVVAFEVTGG